MTGSKAERTFGAPKSLGRLLLYGAVAAILVFKSWMWGEVYAPTDFFDWFYPWRHAAVQTDLHRPLPVENFAVRDDLLAAIPQDMLIADTLRAGRLPLWNPYNLCGLPFSSYYRTVYYPPRSVLLWAFGAVAGSLLSIWLHLVVAGWAMSWFLRLIGLREAAADFGGLVWMLAGYTTAWIDIYYVPIGAALLPLLMAGMERLAVQRSVGRCALPGLAMGALFLGCHWQFAVYGVCFSVLYFCSRCSWRAWAWIFVVGAFGLAVGAAQILPTLQLARQADRPPLPTLEAVNAQCRLLPEQFAMALLPETFGSPPAGFFWSRVNSTLETFSELSLYIGLFPLFLALGSFSGGHRSWRFMACGAVICLLLATGSPFYTLVWYVLPPIRFFTPLRILWIFAFCMSVLAALGADQLLARGRLPGGLGGSLGLLGTIVAIELAALSMFTPGGDGFDERIKAFISYRSFPLPSHADPDRYIKMLLRAMGEHYDPTRLHFLGPLLLGFVLVVLAILLQRRAVGIRFAWGVVVGLTCVDLLAFGVRANPSFPPSTLFPPTLATRLMTAVPEGYRVGGVGRMPHPELLLGYRVSDVGGYESLAPGPMRRLVTAINGEVDNYMIMDFYKAANFNHGLADLFGVRLVYTEPAEHAPSPDRPVTGVLPSWTRPVACADLVVGENPTALPRVFWVGTHEVLADENEVLARMLARNFDPRKAVLLSRAPVAPPAGGPPPAAATGNPQATAPTGSPQATAPTSSPEATAPTGNPQAAAPTGSPEAAAPGPSPDITVVRPRPERFEIDTRLPAAGWLVISESTYPGWRATLDGVDVPIEPAFVAFQAVAVPAGAHRVELVFDPPLQRYGMWISLIAVAGLGLLSLRATGPTDGE